MCFDSDEKWSKWAYDVIWVIKKWSMDLWREFGKIFISLKSVQRLRILPQIYLVYIIIGILTK